MPGAENALIYLAGALDGTYVRDDGIIFPNDLKQVKAYYINLAGIDPTAKTTFLAKTGATFVDPAAGVPKVDVPFRTHILRDDMANYLQPEMTAVRRWNAATDRTALNL